MGLNRYRMSTFNKVFFILFILNLLAGFAHASENWDSFKAKTEGYYHYLMKSDIRNFTCFFTTGSYLSYIDSYSDSTYSYPLKFIWTRMGKIYFVLHAFPIVDNSNQRKEVLEKIQLTKNQFQGFYLDWLNFLIISPISDIPDTSSLSFSGDTVKVFYTGKDGGNTRVTKVFLKSGRLYKAIVESNQDKVVNYPYYTEVEGKWLCTGWDTQIIQEGEIKSGLATRLELMKFENNWMPTKVDLIVQTIEKPGESYGSTIFIKDYVFDVPLQELENSDNPAN